MGKLAKLFKYNFAYNRVRAWGPLKWWCVTGNVHFKMVTHTLTLKQLINVMKFLIAGGMIDVCRREIRL